MNVAGAQIFSELCTESLWEQVLKMRWDEEGVYTTILMAGFAYDEPNVLWVDPSDGSIVFNGHLEQTTFSVYYQMKEISYFKNC